MSAEDGMTLLSVAAGGAIGAALRWALMGWIGRGLGAGFPFGTMAVNVLGSVAMGFAAIVLMERAPGSWARWAPFLMTGVLGGFTTFSAFSLDAFFLLERGRWIDALGYVAGSLLLCIGGLWAGLTIGRVIVSAQG